jgi:hypothetical protein
MESANSELLGVILAAARELVLETVGDSEPRARDAVPTAWTPPEPAGGRLAAARHG